MGEVSQQLVQARVTSLRFLSNFIVYMSTFQSAFYEAKPLSLSHNYFQKKQICCMHLVAGRNFTEVNYIFAIEIFFTVN